MTKKNQTAHESKANARDKTRDKWGVKAKRQTERRNKNKRRNLESGKHWK